MKRAKSIFSYFQYVNISSLRHCFSVQNRSLVRLSLRVMSFLVFVFCESFWVVVFFDTLKLTRNTSNNIIF